MGPAIIVLVLVVGIPVGFLVSMAAIAGALGWVLKTEIDQEYEGTEYLEISR